MGMIARDPSGHYRGPSCPVGAVVTREGGAHNTRVNIAQLALVKALAPSSDWTVLRDFLQLAMLWDLCPTAKEITCAHS